MTVVGCMFADCGPERNGIGSCLHLIKLDLFKKKIKLDWTVQRDSDMIVLGYCERYLISMKQFHYGKITDRQGRLWVSWANANFFKWDPLYNWRIKIEKFKENDTSIQNNNNKKQDNHSINPKCTILRKHHSSRIFCCKNSN